MPFDSPTVSRSQKCKNSGDVLKKEPPKIQVAWGKGRYFDSIPTVLLNSAESVEVVEAYKNVKLSSSSGNVNMLSSPSKRRHINSPGDELISGVSPTKGERYIEPESTYMQTCRWYNLTHTLWDLIVLEAHRMIDKPTLSSFWESMFWRVRVDIAVSEFSGIYKDWLAHIGHYREKKQINLSTFRYLVLQRSVQESDLDLIIGLILHEEYKLLLESPLQIKLQMEVCNDVQEVGYNMLRNFSFYWIRQVMVIFVLMICFSWHYV